MYETLSTGRARSEAARNTSVLATLLLFSPLCFAQEQVDLNSYYRFPVSIGAYAQGFTVFEAGLSVRVPIPPWWSRVTRPEPQTASP